MTEFSRASTRKTVDTIKRLASNQDISLGGFVRNKNEQTVVGVIVFLSKPLKESEIRDVKNE